MVASKFCFKKPQQSQLEVKHLDTHGRSGLELTGSAPGNS